MMKKILIAVDGSHCALRAVDYAARHFSGIKGLKVTLLHVMPYPPAPLWDDGHIPSPEEKKERDGLIDGWLKNRKSQLGPIFRNATELLVARGIEPEMIETKAISDSIDPAGSILEEAKDGGYEMLLLGRCGGSATRYAFMGSVTNKIVSHGAGTAICIVE
jgi:nucleotide-binding universal stress UspA family protein